MTNFSLFEKRVETLQLTTTQKTVLARIVAAPTAKVASEDISRETNMVAARDLLIKLGIITFKEGILAALTGPGKKLAQEENVIDAAGTLTEYGKELTAGKEKPQQPAAESYQLIKQVTILAEAQYMKDVVEKLKSDINKLFPNSYLSIVNNTNLMDDLTIRFTVEPKDKWPSNIFHNAQYIILMLDEKGKRRETGEGPYQVEVTSHHIKGVKFRKKTGTLDQVVNHIVDFFTKLKETIK